MPTGPGHLIRRAAVVALLATTTAAGTALAHHGWSGYRDDPFALTGVVEQIELGHPHGHLMVRTDDGLWDVVLGPPARNRRAGLVDGVIGIGAEVTAEGKRHRSADRLEMKTERLRVGDRAYDIYPERL